MAFPCPASAKNPVLISLKGQESDSKASLGSVKFNVDALWEHIKFSFDNLKLDSFSGSFLDSLGFTNVNADSLSVGAISVSLIDSSVSGTIDNNNMTSQITVHGGNYKTMWVRGLDTKVRITKATIEMVNGLEESQYGKASQEYTIMNAQIDNGSWFVGAKKISMQMSKGTFQGPNVLDDKKELSFVSGVVLTMKDSQLLMNQTYPGNFSTISMSDNSIISTQTTDNPVDDVFFVVGGMTLDESSKVACNGGWNPFVCNKVDQFGCIKGSTKKAINATTAFDRCFARCTLAAVPTSALTCETCMGATIRLNATSTQCTNCTNPMVADERHEECVDCSKFADGEVKEGVCVLISEKGFAPSKSECGSLKWGKAFSGECPFSSILKTFIPIMILLIILLVGIPFVIIRRRKKKVEYETI